MSLHILVVEDEPSIATLITYNLKQAGYTTDVANNGRKALQMVENQHYDFIVLDLMLPEIDGYEVCQTIRQNNNDVPILMLTAKTEEDDKVLGLKMGADDYLTKPFSPKELVARIEAIMRRMKKAEKKQHEPIVIGDLKIDVSNFQVFVKDEKIELTKKEFEVLVYLVQRRETIVSRDELLHSVWGYDYVGDTRTVDMQVSRLRDKIEEDSKNPKYIKTVWGLGYKVEDPYEKLDH